MAIAQFSDDARTEFKLNSYSNKEQLLDAINKISYKGGNTKTGEYAQSRLAAEEVGVIVVWWNLRKRVRDVDQLPQVQVL